MKYDPHKAFPYPVLEDASSTNNDDYVRVGFQPTISLETHNENNKRILLKANFASLKEQAILKCIKQGQAEYAVHVLCTKTSFRYLHHSSNNEFTYLFEEGDLHGKVTVMPCIICMKTIREYHSDNFHHEFNQAVYDMAPGSVLAIDEPEDFYVDADPSRSLRTVFHLDKDNKVPKGEFQFDCNEDRIIIRMNEADYIPFNAARKNHSIRNFLIMSVYYPVLVEVLKIISSDEGSYEEFKWYRAIKSKLVAKGLDISNDSDCYLYAQRLMDLPLQALPLMEDETND